MDWPKPSGCHGRLRSGKLVIERYWKPGVRIVEIATASEWAPTKWYGSSTGSGEYRTLRTCDLRSKILQVADNGPMELSLSASYTIGTLRLIVRH